MVRHWRSRCLLQHKNCSIRSASRGICGDGLPKNAEKAVLALAVVMLAIRRRRPARQSASRRRCSANAPRVSRATLSGLTMYDALTTWELSSADKPSVVIPNLATEWKATTWNGARVPVPIGCCCSRCRRPKARTAALLPGRPGCRCLVGTSGRPISRSTPQTRTAATCSRKLASSSARSIRLAMNTILDR